MSRKYLFTVVVFFLWISSFYVISDLTKANIIQTISRINPLSIFATALLYLLAVSSGIFVLYRSLKSVGLKPPILGLSKAWIFGSFIDNIMPTVTPLGEASMAYFLEKFYRISYTKSLAAIGVYVSSWALSVSIFSAAAVILSQYYVGIPSAFFLPVVVIVLIFSLITTGWILFLIKKDLVEGVIYRLMRIYNKIYNLVKKGKVDIDLAVVKFQFEKSYSNLDTVLKNKKQLISSTLLFLIPQMTHVLSLYVLLLGFGVQISFFSVLLVHIVASVAGLISFIPSGLGVYEVVSSSALSIGMTSNIAIATIFLYRLVFVWLTNFLGGFIGLTAGIKEDADISMSSYNLTN